MPFYNESQIELYPNPTYGLLMVNGITGTAEIYNIYGRLVKTMETPLLDIRGLSRGIYYIRLSDKEGRVSTRKVVKE